MSADRVPTSDALAMVGSFAEWSAWAPFASAAEGAPRLPGVYMFRLPATNQVIYVGMAGERNGSGRPQGLWGRLSIYRRGKGAVSGFGEAVLDRALADEGFLTGQLESLKATGPMRAKEWAIAAIAWLAPEVRWAVCKDRESALALETQVEEAIGALGLWNRVSIKRTSAEYP